MAKQKQSSMSFGDLIRAKRLQWAYTQSEIAKRVGMPPHEYSQMENGLAKPPQDKAVITRIANNLGIRPRLLLKKAATAQVRTLDELREATGGRVIVVDQSYIEHLLSPPPDEMAPDWWKAVIVGLNNSTIPIETRQEALQELNQAARELLGKSVLIWVGQKDKVAQAVEELDTGALVKLMRKLYQEL